MNSKKDDIANANNEVFEAIRDIVASKFSVDTDSITINTDFISDLNADSLDVVEIAIKVEEYFRITLPDNIGNIKVVGDLVEIINNITPDAKAAASHM